MRRPRHRNPREVWLTLLAITLVALFVGIIRG